MLPTYNEEESFSVIERCMNRVLRENPNYDWEFLFVNDGSKDNSLQQMIKLKNRDSHYHYVDLSRNYGKETAMLAGFDFAKGDAVIVMDADMQHPVDVIPEMLKYWEDGFDDVFAQRISSKENWLKKKTSQWYYRILQKLTRIPIQKDTGDFRLLDKSCVEALKRLRETERNTKGLYSWIGFKKKGVFYEQKAREAGETKWSFLQLMNLAINGITSYTIAPLRLSSILGFIISLIAFVYLLIILVKTLIFGDCVAGFPTIMVTLLFFAGTQLIAIGILGEYLGRVYNEVKGRPVYFIQSYDGNQKDNASRGTPLPSPGD